MINQESQLKLQAYLDGELSAKETAAVTDWLARDASAQALLNELENTCGALNGFEEGIKLPETREFYWLKIERQIERETKTAPVAESGTLFDWLQRHVMSLGSVAVAICLLGVVTMRSGGTKGQFGEMELSSDKMGAYTFRDHQAQLTMVWLYNHDDDSQFTESDSAAKVETE